MSAKLIPGEHIENRILLLRGQKVILDFHLAELYGVATKALNQAVSRNTNRFPPDFMFQLSPAEWRAILKSQFVTSSPEAAGSDAPNMWSQLVTTSAKKRRLTNLPYAFTEQGVAMLSSVLRGPRAVQVNIEIMRAFVRLRQWLASNAEFAKRLNDLENKYDAQFKVVFDAIRQLMAESNPKEPRREIGFHTLRETSRRRKTARPERKVSYL